MKHNAFTLPKNWPVSVAGAFAFGILFNYFTGTDWPSLIFFSVAAAAGAFVSLFFIGRYEAGLDARMNGDMPFVWEVWMRGVKIGTITDAQYAAIQRCVFSDSRLVVAQVLNLVRVALNIVGKAFVSVPLLMFWLAVVAVVLAPESISIPEPDALAESLRNLFQMVAVMSVAVVGAMVVLGYRFGFRNHYGDAVADMIRRQCNTPTEGSIYLSKVGEVTTK